MERSSDPVDTVRRYFDAWRSHDIESLRGIFLPDARYVIVPICRTLDGIVEIAQYWERNRRRQCDLRVCWTVICVSSKAVRVHFTATFYDNEESQYQEVVGSIEFHLHHEGKVTELSETYTKRASKENDTRNEQV